ncbi:hypothetical protein G6F46_013094 [Rhizopus delemar]|uniref:Uncharacterized protein n=3 Tax=Rhizopus TaxID=4842 RepID=I1C808_RHIO9|nr:hypothetical protein RO3G_09298 [Rhizopus delemar RA 99-880]KAG1442371.1 hypothetical protein G6F55_012984 [Rhizopus delemar]KAG1532034.1 hypothetical protein G6F51_013291 [Rhizopus arrhizus]KAG1486839.1 hypothetical protein G6F54_013049 [Rhizopus delemar]KAG1491579.1 hypothetical protein G6F53_013075 [Rhizopus delemar]|eukprot:EIE84588.1 hypothetical protein RO3G_09298 [Rhizopus delemar RA 99-880]
MSSWDPDYWLKELANPNFLAVDFNPGERKTELEKEKNEGASGFLLDLNDPLEGVTRTTIRPFQFNFVGTDKKPRKEETPGIEGDVDKEVVNEVIIDFASLLSTETENEKKVKHINITCTLTDLVLGDSSDIIQAVLDSLRKEKEAEQQRDPTEPVTLDEEDEKKEKSSELTISFSELTGQQEKDKAIEPDFMNFVKEKKEDDDEKEEVDETKSVISFSDLAEEEEKKKEKKSSFNLDAPEFVPPPKKQIGIYRNGLFIPTQPF